MNLKVSDMQQLFNNVWYNNAYKTYYIFGKNKLKIIIYWTTRLLSLEIETDKLSLLRMVFLNATILYWT